MDILSYLSELIQTRKSVGIYGLGTVYKKKQPGRYDAASQSFLPPSFHLEFSPDFTEESALADLISKRNHISADEAIAQIHSFSSALQSQLETEGEAVLGGLGKLTRRDHHLFFQPAENSFGFDFFGFPSIKADQEPLVEELLPEIPEAEEQPEESAPEPSAEPAVLESPLPEVAAEEEEEETLSAAEEPYRKKDEQQLRAEIEALNFYRSRSPVSGTSAPEQQEVIWNMKAEQTGTPAPPAPPYAGGEVYNPEEEEKSGTPLYVKILLILLALAIIAGFTFILQPQWFSGVTTHPATPETRKAVPVPAVPASPVKDTLKEKPAPTPLDTARKITPAAPASIPVTQDSVVYEIIGASMHDQKEADKFIELMKKSGINAKVVTNMAGKRLKMSIATLKDEQSARQELEVLSKKLKIPGIYIYRNKL